MDKAYKINNGVIYKKINNDYYISTAWYNDYLLEDLSAELFEKLVSGADLDRILAQICEEYEVESDMVRADLEQFIQKMLNGRLISPVGMEIQQCFENKSSSPVENVLFEDSDFSIYEKARKSNIPIKVDFHVTYQCNLRCRHCYAEERKNIYGNQKSLDLNEIRAMFDQLDQLGTFFVRITGGEPFIHPRFMEILEYACGKGFAVSVVTNGTLLDHDKIMQLKKCTLREIVFSIHGATSKIHDDFVGHPGAFNEMYQNILLCKEQQLPVKLTWVVTEDSYPDIEEVLELSRELGLPLSISPRIVPGMEGSLKPKDFRMTKATMLNFIKKINYKPFAMNCTIGTKLQINYDGTVQPCLFVGDILGDIRKEDLKNIWHRLVETRNERYQNFYKEPENCNACPNSQYCHRCPGEALIENGYPNTCSENAKWESEAYSLAIAEEA